MCGQPGVERVRHLARHLANARQPGVVRVVVALACQRQPQPAQLRQRRRVIVQPRIVGAGADQRIAHLDILVQDQRQPAPARRHVGDGAHHQVDGGDLRRLRVEVDAVEVIFQNVAGVILQPLLFRLQ
jgi:hypothetical protein